MESILGDKIEITIKDHEEPGVWKCLMSSGAEIFLHVPVEWDVHVSKTSSATVLDFTVSWKCEHVHITVSIENGSALFLHPSVSKGKIEVVELFGGLSGWSYASKAFETAPIAVIERDERVAKATAEAMQCDLISADEFLARAVERSISSTVVVLSCVSNKKVWMSFGLLNVGFGMASLILGKETGLASDDGLIFTTILRLSGSFHMMALMVENVPGIVHHGDFHRLLASATLDGMKFVIGSVHNVQRVAPVFRDRWLATFCHCTVLVDPTVVQSVQKLSFASECFECPLPGPTLSASDSVHPASSKVDRSRLSIPDEAFVMMRRSDMLPKWLREKINWTKRDPVLTARTINGSMKLSGVMARYGSQHLLPVEHLLQKGLQTVIYDDQGELRFFCPWEILSALGFPPSVVISSDLQESFQQVGNSISPFHAWIQIAKTHLLLGLLSPFPAHTKAENALGKIREQAIRLSAFSPVIQGAFAKLEPVQLCSTEEDGSPAFKKSRIGEREDEGLFGDLAITPTVPFKVQENSDVASCITKVDFEPAFAIDKTASTAAHSFCKGGILFLKHSMLSWMMMVHGDVDETLQVLIPRALPHAKDEHFMSFECRGREIQWTDIVTCAPPATVTFKPVLMPFHVVPPNGQLMIFHGDVTWTMATLLSFVASRMRCHTDSLRLQYSGISTEDCDYVMEFPTWTFHVIFQACLPGYAAFVHAQDQIADPGMAPTFDGCIRFVARHPSKKITRTACVKSPASIASVVRTLFSDLSASVTWTVHVDGVPMDTDTLVTKSTHFDIEWDCFKPLMPTRVEAAQFELPIDSVQLQVKSHGNPERWIRSPFRCKAQIVRADESMKIMQLAASYVSHAQLDISLTCHVGGRIVDPALSLHEVDMKEVLCFKIAPLVGGAKKGHDTVKSRVASAIESHGVAKDSSQERAQAFLQKADIETLAKHENADDDGFWKAMKEEANRVHFRLVFRNEMRQARNESRKKPPSKFPKVKQNPGDHEFVANASNVVIDMKHFWDDQNNIELIESSRFGPDQRGLAVMSLSEANRHTQGVSISVDALAILVVGKKFDSSDCPFVMPAHTIKGEPVVIHAALRQFGDRHVTFKAAIPVTQVDCAASTVVELHIYRSEVGNWKECSVPLHYLGVHISAVRGSSLIATWALKTWKLSRQASPFKEADLWHGYIRVHDDILDQVLGRSGQSGIYVSPKDANRRHDDRFTVIAMPDCGLAEVQKRAAAHEKSLGIVKLRDQLGIRCRQEHASSLRAALLPESAYVASDGIAADSNIWIMKNMPCEVGREGLQEALEQSGWDATPVRAQGQNRWLVAAKADPPTRHFCINGSFVMVEPVKRQRDHSGVIITAKQVKVDTVVSATSTGVQVAASTRIHEVKAEISDQLEQKMQATNARIAQLSNALELLQKSQSAKDEETKSEIAAVRTEQAFARQKFTELEQSVVASNQTVLQTMQQMMGQMQQSLEANMKQLLCKNESGGDDAKRLRSDQPPKNDAFSHKA
eukprot:s325_g6.t1